MLEEYRISKVTPQIREFIDKYDGNEREPVGYKITLTNVKNPFDYFVQFVPYDAYTEDEFPLGRIIELEDDSDEHGEV